MFLKIHSVISYSEYVIFFTKILPSLQDFMKNLDQEFFEFIGVNNLKSSLLNCSLRVQVFIVIVQATYPIGFDFYGIFPLWLLLHILFAMLYKTLRGWRCFWHYSIFGVAGSSGWSISKNPIIGENTWESQPKNPLMSVFLETYNLKSCYLPLKIFLDTQKVF